LSSLGIGIIINKLLAGDTCVGPTCEVWDAYSHDTVWDCVGSILIQGPKLQLNASVEN